MTLTGFSGTANIDTVWTPCSRVVRVELHAHRPFGRKTSHRDFKWAVTLQFIKSSHCPSETLSYHLPPFSIIFAIKYLDNLSRNQQTKSLRCCNPQTVREFWESDGWSVLNDQSRHTINGFPIFLSFPRGALRARRRRISLALDRTRASAYWHSLEHWWYLVIVTVFPTPADVSITSNHHCSLPSFSDHASRQRHEPRSRRLQMLRETLRPGWLGGERFESQHPQQRFHARCVAARASKGKPGSWNSMLWLRGDVSRIVWVGTKGKLGFQLRLCLVIDIAL